MITNLTPTFDQSVIPQHFYTDYPRFVQLIEFYYQWVAQNKTRIENLRNIDSIEDQFIDDLVQELTNNFPVAATIDKRFVGRHAKDIFRARGTTQGIEQLFRLFLNVEAKVTLPGDYTFRPSSDSYVGQYQVEINNDNDIDSIVGTNVITSSGGSFTIVDSNDVVVNDSRHSVLTVNDVVAPINVGDLIGNTRNSTIVGSLTAVNLYKQSGYGYKQQVVDLIGSSGGYGYGVVSGVDQLDSTFVVNIRSGGGHYTATPQIDISDTVVQSNTSLANVAVGQSVKQTVFLVTPANNIFVANVGSVITLQTGNTSVSATVVGINRSIQTNGNLVVVSSANSSQTTSMTTATNTNGSSNVVVSDISATGTVVGFDSNTIGIKTATHKFYSGQQITVGTQNTTADYVEYFNSPTAVVTQLQATLPVIVKSTGDTNFLSANTQSVVYQSNTYHQAVVGGIGDINISFNDNNNTIEPFVSVYQPFGYGKISIVDIGVTNSQKFIGGEPVIHYSTTNALTLTTNQTSMFSVGDIVCGPIVSAPTFIGIVRAVRGTTIDIGDVKGAINTGDVVFNVTTNNSTTVTGTSTQPIITGTGIVQGLYGTTLRIGVTGGLFVDNGTITGSISRFSSSITGLSVVESNGGANFSVDTHLITEQQTPSAITVVSCGIGFTTPQTVAVVDHITKQVIATGIGSVGPVGIQTQRQSLITSGVSQVSHIIDSDYRQQFAYEIQSPLSFDQYNTSLTRFIHVSGTKMFGSVVLTGAANVHPVVQSAIISQT